MKKVLGGLALAGLLTAGAANAGTITVANTDLLLYGGLSAGYMTQDNELLVTSGTADTFRIYSAVIGLTKEAKSNSPIGFNLALAQFEVPTVLASSDVVNNKGDILGLGDGTGLVGLGQTNDGLKPWLATIDIVPIDGLKISGGILWSKWGERPVTILNNHISRGLMYVFFNPVAYTGVRAEYNITLPGLGNVDVYAGYNQANGLLQNNDPLGFHTGYTATGTAVTMDPKDAYELGIAGTLNLFAKIKYGLHYYDESQGRNIWTLCLSPDFGLIKGGLQFSYSKRDDAIKNYDPTRDISDSFWGIGFNFNISLLDAQIANVEFPMRLEYVKLDRDDAFAIVGDNDTSKDKIWSFTITPTWKPSKNTFVRAEYTYTKADSQIFSDPKKANSSDDTRTTIAVEAGFLF
jgi:opacity protein-like surface antigen